MRRNTLLSAGENRHSLINETVRGCWEHISFGDAQRDENILTCLISKKSKLFFI